MEELIGDEFLRKKISKGKELIEEKEHCTRAEIEEHNVKLVGIYFGAYFCPSSRNFTRILSEFYNEINLDEKQFEVIFASFDKNDEFEQAYAEMPWMAFNPRDARI